MVVGFSSLSPLGDSAKAFSYTHTEIQQKHVTNLMETFAFVVCAYAGNGREKRAGCLVQHHGLHHSHLDLKQFEVSPKMPIKALRNWPLAVCARVWDTDVCFKDKNMDACLQKKMLCKVLSALYSVLSTSVGGCKTHFKCLGDLSVTLINALLPWSCCISLCPAVACSWLLLFYHRSQTDS